MTVDNTVNLTAISRRDRRLTLIAIMTVFLLGALDQTIVSTAMPRIIAELHGLEMYAWTATAYMLASTIMVPIYGKLGDMYGRKIILIAGVSIFLLGSVLCGLSGEFGDLPVLGGGMMQLIVFRAIQGIGSGALFSGAFAVIGDLYPPRERGKVMGWFIAVFTVSSIAGPTLGGFFTDHGTVQWLGYTIAGWRWVFYVNLPLGVIALFLMAAKMRRTNAPIGGRVDYLGAIFLVLTVLPLLLALTWGGHKFAWASPIIMGMLMGSAVALTAFLFVESKVSNPIIPIPLLRNRSFAIINTASFVINMAFLGIVMFMPLYMQVVLGIDATQSGLSMLPLMAGIMISSMISGWLVKKTGVYKPIMIVGCVLLLIGVGLLMQISVDTALVSLQLAMFLVGLGLGPAQSLYGLAVQNAAPPDQLGVATSSSQFFQQIGSTIGVVVFGTILTHNLTIQLPKYLPQIPGMAAQKVDLGHMQERAMQPGRLKTEIHEVMAPQYALIDRAYDGDAEVTKKILRDPLVPDTIKQQLKTLLDPAEQKHDAIDGRQLLENYEADLVSRFNGGLKRGFATAISALYQSAFLIIVLGLIITLFVPVLPLRDRLSTT